MNFYQRMGILPLKKRVNRDKCSFTTKQRMFGVFAIDEILRYRGTRFPGSRTLCHPAVDITTFTLSAALAAFSHWCLNLGTRFMAYFAALVKLNLAIFAKLNLSCSWSWRLFANWTHSLEPARLLSPSPKLIKLLTKNINWNTIFLKSIS